MAAALIAMAGIAAGTAIAGWLSSEQARKASASERRRMQQMLDNLKDPNFDMTKIDYPTFQVLQKYVPRVSDYVAEQDPKFIEMSAAAKEGRDAQLGALRDLQAIGQGRDIEQEIAVSRAGSEAAQQARGGEEAILESMRRRGQLGSGMELAARLSNQQASQQRGALAGQDAAIAARRGRLNALMQGAQLGGQVRSQEEELAAKNAAIINAFNQRSAANRNSYNQYADATANDAQRFNMSEAQRINEKNKGGRYDAARDYQSMYNDLAQKRFNNDMGKITGQMVQSGQNQDAIGRNAVDRQNLYTGLGNAAQSGIGYYNENENRRLDREAYGRRKSDVYGE